MDMLYTLADAFGPSGCEDAVAQIVANELKKYTDTVEADALGNVVGHKAGNGKKIMIAAHIDEIGIIVTYIEKEGFLRFAPVGGVDCRDLVDRQVVFANGTVGVVAVHGNADAKKSPDIANMYIDIGVTDADAAKQKVSVGDMAVYSAHLAPCGSCVVGKALDNRAGAYVLLNIAKQVQNSPYDIYYVFTTQEEVGLRGAKTAAFAINPDYALAIDVTATGDTPDCPVNNVKLGAGACIKIMDKSVIASPLMRRALQQCADDCGIDVQNEILSFGGTDAGAIHTVCDGAVSGAISIPLRYIHTPCEMANVSDINNCIKLGTEFLTKDYFAK